MPSEILSHLLATRPWLVDYLVAVYVCGFVVSHCLRAGWPDEAERGRGVRIIMALSDAAQLVFFSGVKSLARSMREEAPPPVPPEDPKP